MSPTLALILALLATHTGLKVKLQFDEDEVKQMQQREEYLHEEMTRLLQEIQDSSCTTENLLHCVLQEQWLFWVTAAALSLLLLTVGYRLIRRRKCHSSSCKERASRMEMVDGEKQDLSSMDMLKELVDDVLAVCRVFSKRNFMPELHAAPGTDTTNEDCGTQENSSTYRLLVILRPPPGHTFILDSTKQRQTGRIRVALQCLCPGEPLLGKMCFLHPSAGQLPMEQDWYLMDTLCTGCFLDTKKVICWVQMLVVSAWLLLPQSQHCQLTALPSEKCCRFQLSSCSGMESTIEMALAVQPASSTYVRLE